MKSVSAVLFGFDLCSSDERIIIAAANVGGARAMYISKSLKSYDLPMNRHD